jgi:hypothetical protein
MILRASGRGILTVIQMDGKEAYLIQNPRPGFSISKWNESLETLCPHRLRNPPLAKSTIIAPAIQKIQNVRASAPIKGVYFT